MSNSPGSRLGMLAIDRQYFSAPEINYGFANSVLIASENGASYGKALLRYPGRSYTVGDKALNSF